MVRGGDGDGDDGERVCVVRAGGDGDDDERGW